jgi:hypothetical protein
MTDERKQVKEIVDWAVKDVHRWLTDHVAGFAVATEEMRHDWISYAESITQSLLFTERLLCDCSYKACSRQHSLASRAPSEPIKPFVRRAVIGPGGLKANSIIKGMLFPHLKDHELKKVKVEFKQCPTCQTKYEGSVCANPECREPFDPCTTAVIGREWLIKKGAYAPIRRWGCSHQLRCAETIRKHYYEQIRCREKPAWRKDGEPTLRVRHNDEEHDCCPWHSCPNLEPSATGTSPLKSRRLSPCNG